MELRALLLLPLCFPGLHTEVLEVKRHEGSSLLITCPYTPQTNYVSQKAWCHIRSGQYEHLVETTYPPQYPHWYTNGKAGIQDNFINGIVSISMINLRVEDSGTYCCASRFDAYTYRLLKTISLNVFKELHKGELDSLSVQCPYRTLGYYYSTGTKAWCRTHKSNCINWLRANYPSTQTNSKALEERILIEEDTQEGIITMTMKKLQARDNGVYWCALNRDSRITRIMEVKLSVFKIMAVTTLSSAAGTSQATPGNAPAPSSNVNTYVLLSGVLSILLILALVISVTLCIRQCKQLERRGNRQADHIYEKTEDVGQLDTTERMKSPKDESKDLEYVTLNFKSQLSPEDPLYCNVKPSQTQRKLQVENVEYATIALK
ncbi:TRML2 protein, partial [Urocolius indicus]|nr:TRML2 protein [Urocolius indicus]